MLKSGKLFLFKNNKTKQLLATTCFWRLLVPNRDDCVLRLARKPLGLLLTTVGEFQWEDAAFVQMQLVLVRLGVMQHLHIAALHAHSQPFSSGTVTQWEDLWQGYDITEGSGSIKTTLKEPRLTAEWQPRVYA